MSSSALDTQRCPKRPRADDADAGANPDAPGAHEPESLRRPISPPRKRHRPSTITSPWQLTWIRDLPESLNHDALSLRDLLGDPLIAECWQFNFLHDIPFVLDALDPDTRHLVKLHVVHGFWKQDDPRRAMLMKAAAKHSNVQLHTAPMPEMFGTHHSKMMVLLRHDETAQVIIHTANMIPKDWTNMTNALWKSPLLPRLAKTSSETSPPTTHAPGSGERFKSDLLEYLKRYDRHHNTCHALVAQLEWYDFSAIKAALVASVPGRHKAGMSERTNWGWPAMREHLKSIPCAQGKSDIVVQVSSIATLGAKDDWLRKSLFASLATCKTTCSPQPTFRVVFPTADEIRRSLDGYNSGASIHTKTQSAQQAKQLLYLHPIFHHWANDSSDGVYDAGSVEDVKQAQDGGRQRAAPHIKTYVRYAENGSIDWAMLTSANLSKQAWGEAVNAAGEVRIASWEIGVLIWPGLLAEGATMVGTFQSDSPDERAIDRTDATTVIGLRIPYSLPLQRYGQSETPWVATKAHNEPDWMGNVWGG